MRHLPCFKRKTYPKCIFLMYQMFDAISLNSSCSTNSHFTVTGMTRFGPGPLQYLNRLLENVGDDDVAERFVSDCKACISRGGTPQQAEAFIRVILHLPMNEDVDRSEEEEEIEVTEQEKQEQAFSRSEQQEMSMPIYNPNGAILSRHEHNISAIRNQVARILQRSRTALDNARVILRGQERRRFEVMQAQEQERQRSILNRREQQRLEEEHLRREFAERRKKKYETLKQERKQ